MVFGMKTEPSTKKPFPAYLVFDMDFTLVIADISAEFFREIAKQNGLPEFTFVEKLRQKIDEIDPFITEWEAGKRKIPEKPAWLAEALKKGDTPYAGWAFEQVFSEMIPDIASGKLRLDGKPITRVSLVEFAANRVKLMPGMRDLLKTISSSHLIGIKDCFIVTAGLKPFAEGVALQLAHTTKSGVRAIIPLQNIFGLDVLTTPDNRVCGLKNFHKNQKIANVKKIEEFVRKDIVKKGWPTPKHGNPLCHLIYIGDGITDAPAMKYVASGGHRGGSGMTIQLHPDEKLIRDGVIEFVFIGPNLQKLWKELIKPYIEASGDKKAKQKLRKQIGGGMPAKTSLLHRYEIFLGKIYGRQAPSDRLPRIAKWQRQYLTQQKRSQKIKMWLSRYREGIKRGFNRTLKRHR
ncbi:MAG: HAD family hydrolase [Candidatus Diapherotrites archaeon]